MTIIQAAKYLEQIALSSPYIRTTKEGSVYDIMNTNGKIKYGVFVLSQTQHRQDDLFDYIGFNAFVIDRLDDDLESNRLQIQSTAKEVLANIVLTFKNRFYGSTFEQLVFHPFTEKFTDLCAGQYCQLNIKVPRTLICEDSYGELTHSYELVPLVVTITENGVKEYKPETFDAEGFENVTIRVNVDNSGSYSSGYTSGYTDGYISGTTDGYSSGKTDGIEEQKAKLISTSITENGVFERVDGYSSIEVNVPQSAYTSGYTQEDLDNAYASGVTSGITEQKAKLISTSVTENGVFEREDGFSSIEVNVPSGASINNQTKSISITENGTSAITYDNGFTGLETVNIEVNIQQTGYTQEDLDRAYQSGYTKGWNDAKADSGSTSGETSGYTNEYLTFEIISGGTIYWYADNSNTKTIQYSINGNKWETKTSSQFGSGSTIGTFQSGDKVRLKAINTNYYDDYLSSRNYFKMSSNIRLKIYGNIMSLLYGDNFSEAKTLVSACTFSSLFNQCTGLIDAENLILPATTLTEKCYANMFNNCYNLIKAPTLPATTLVQQCYANMFYMYQTNTSKLNYVKCLATDISANLCTNGWLNNVSATGTFVKASGADWSGKTGSSGIPSGWTVLEE